jgi:hypothetical protein
MQEIQAAALQCGSMAVFDSAVRDVEDAPTEALMENDGLTRPRSKFTLLTVAAPYWFYREFAVVRGVPGSPESRRGRYFADPG